MALAYYLLLLVQIAITMPSRLPPDKRRMLCAEGLPEKELQLRRAQARDALQLLRKKLHAKQYYIKFRNEALTGGRHRRRRRRNPAAAVRDALIVVTPPPAPRRAPTCCPPLPDPSHAPPAASPGRPPPQRALASHFPRCARHADGTALALAVPRAPASAALEIAPSAIAEAALELALTTVHLALALNRAARQNPSWAAQPRARSENAGRTDRWAANPRRMPRFHPRTSKRGGVNRAQRASLRVPVET
ncbi:hypothetical protein GGG16DRAFT_119497 [Schizophyllum commune]